MSRMQGLIRKIGLALFTLCFYTTVMALSSTCPETVEVALDTTDQFCQNTGRNQVCYGHMTIHAQPMPDAQDFTFSTLGDIVDVDALQSLQLSPLDSSTGTWGIVLMRIQANLPNTLPGQNVTMLAFGDTLITNAAESRTTLDVTAAAGDSNVNIRVSPSETGTVLGTLTPGQVATAIGRTADSAWLYVRLPDNTGGWVAASLMRSAGDLSALDIADLAKPDYGAMQAFYLDTGVGSPGCGDLPTNGILVQAPAGSGTIDLSINDVQVEMGATLYLRAEADDALIVSVVEGAALVEVGGEARPVVEGGEVAVPLNGESVPDDIPGETVPYNQNLLDSLPVDGLDRPVEVAPPLSADDADILTKYETYFEAIDLADYTDLLDYLAAKGGASEAEITAYLEDMGYEVGSADASEDSADTQKDPSTNSASTADETPIKLPDDPAGTGEPTIQPQGDCGDGEVTILIDCMPDPDEKKDDGETDGNDDEPCILSLAAECGDEDQNGNDEPDEGDSKKDGGDSEPSIELPNGNEGDEPPPDDGEDKKADEGSGDGDINLGGL